jgi:hypothetical protein
MKYSQSESEGRLVHLPSHIYKKMNTKKLTRQDPYKQNDLQSNKAMPVRQIMVKDFLLISVRPCIVRKAKIDYYIYKKWEGCLLM